MENVKKRVTDKLLVIIHTITVSDLCVCVCVCVELQTNVSSEGVTNVCCNLLSCLFKHREYYT